MDVENAFVKFFNVILCIYTEGNVVDNISAGLKDKRPTIGGKRKRDFQDDITSQVGLEVLYKGNLSLYISKTGSDVYIVGSEPVNYWV